MLNHDEDLLEWDHEPEAEAANDVSTRFRYQDSTPFLPNFDLVATLSDFVHKAVEVLTHDRRISQLQADMAASKDTCRDELEAVEELVKTVHETASLMTEDTDKQPLNLIAQRVDEALDRASNEARARLTSERDGKCGECEAEIGALQSQMLKLAHAFLLHTDLPSIHRELLITLQDGVYHGQARLQFEGDYGVTYDFDAAALGWTQGRPLSALASSLVLPVDTPGRWFGASKGPSDVALHKLTIGSLRINPDSLEIGLRKPRAAVDHVCVELRLEDGFVQATTRPLGLDGGTVVSTARHATQVEALWETIMQALGRATIRRTRVAHVALSQHGPLTGADVPKLIDRLALVLGPMVRQLEGRSVGADELALKVDEAAGCRQERFVRRSELVAALESLRRSELVRLEPLGLGCSTAITPVHSNHAEVVALPTVPAQIAEAGGA